MIKQLSLFDPRSQPIPPRDPGVRACDKKRLSDQSRKVLARLRAGPATNAELGAFGLNSRARISDLRGKGFVITNYDKRKNGLSMYRIEHDPGGY